MVILFLTVGFIFGSAAGATVIWAGGSVILAILAYSIVGSMGALGVSYTLFALRNDEPHHATWDTVPDADPIASA